MTEANRTEEHKLCPHGVDSRTAHCCQCADPAFHAAKGLPMDVINGMATLHAPAAAALVMDHKVRQEIATDLRKRADWLRSEYLNGGNFEHLKAREDECRHLADRIGKGITP